MHFSALRQTLALAVVAVVVQQTRGEAFHECKFWNNYIRDTTNKCQYYQCVPSTYTNGNWQFKATLMKCAYPTSVPEDYDDPRESAFDAVYTNPCSGTNFGSCEISGTGPEPRGWTQWGTWSACSVTCGSGSRSRVRSCPPGSNCAGASIEEDACNSGPCVVAPGKPTTFVNVLGTSMNVTWIPADSRATAYYVQYRQPGQFAWINSREEMFKNWILIPNLFLGAYEVRVVAKGVGGQETPSDTKTVQILGSVPGKPMATINVVGSSMNVSWIPADNLATSYYVEYRRTGDFNWQRSREERFNTWLWLQNLPQGIYEVRVVAKNAQGQETRSDIYPVEIKGAAPGKPTVYLQAVNNGFNVSWTAADNLASGFYAQYRRAGAFQWMSTREERRNSWIWVQNLGYGTYEVRVVARNNGGQETISDVSRVELKQAGPSAPVVYFNQQGNGVNVSWTADPMGTIYYVQYRRPGSFVWQRSEEEMFNNWIFLRNLQPGTYEMRVMVRGVNGQEVPSQVYTYEIQQQGPSAPMVYFTQQGNGVNVSWTADPMGTVYYVQYRRPGSFVWQKSQDVMTNNWIFLSNLQPGTYEMRVMVRGANGQEVPSQVYTYEIRQQGPSAPMVYFTQQGNGVNVSWTADPMGTVYYVQYRRPGSFVWQKSQEVMNNNYIFLSNLQPGTYEMRVMVRGANGQEVPSQVYTYEIQRQAPAKPTQVFVTKYGQSGMNISWFQPQGDGVLTYYIQYRRSGDVQWMSSPEERGRNWIIVQNLPMGVRYDTRVVVRNAAGQETYSDIYYMDMTSGGGDAPIKPTNVYITYTMSTMNVTWSYSPQQTNLVYYVQYRPVGTTNWVNSPQVMGDQRFIYISGLQPGTSYETRLVAMNMVTGAETASDPQRVDIMIGGVVDLREWNAWTACSAQCNGGTQFRYRDCFGVGCMGIQLREQRPCNTQACTSQTIGQWEAWTSCTAECGGGIRYRIRTCTGPCTAVQRFEIQTCNTQHCAGDVTYGQWNAWEACSVTCGVGRRERHRSCTGTGCALAETGQIQSCYFRECASMDLHEWGVWTTCTKPCDGGVQYRYRECFGMGCDKVPQREDKPCNTAPCVNVQAWGEWGVCSKECDGGFQTRARTCTGLGCDMVQKTEQRPCNTQSCMDLHDWGAWGMCSAQCNGGRQFRFRECYGTGCNSAKLQEEKPCNTQPCLDISQWGQWGTCSVTCGGGVKTRARQCFGVGCGGVLLTEQMPCNPNPCSTTSQWTQWGPCSVTCGAGEQARTRTCTGAACAGQPLRETRICQLQPCRALSQWTQWGTCSVTCGDGTQKRMRTCTGAGCQGVSLEETRSCSQQACINLSQWSAWGTCSVTCGEGMEMRTRTCVGSNCANQQTQETRPCTRPACQVLGDWGQWTTCSATCGGGMQFRNRPCSGNACQFLRTRESRSCNTDQCVVQAQVSQWTQWGQCSAQCGTGQQERTRQCMAGDCTGMMLRESQNCNTQPCVQYGQWTQWGTCSVTCGSGVQRRTRTCSGLQCNLNPGALEETRACTLQDCVSVSLSEWGQWGACNAECDGGVQIRNRACFGNGCQGQRLQETRSCNQQPCVSLSQWGQWSVCPVTCNGGTQVRSRACFGSGCADVQLQESRPCGQEPCVSEPQVTEWGQWTQCTATCNGGIQFRSRACFGAACVGVQLQESQACNQQPCVSVTEWSNWGQCSAECDGGLQVRQRTCTGGAVNCQNVQLQESRACNSQPCVTLTQWSEWGTCSVTCGQGLQFRNRQCTGSRCAAVIKQESRPCTLQQCPSTNTGPVKPSVFVSPLSTGQGVNVTWVPQTPNMGYTYVLQYRTPGAFSWTSGGMETFRGWMVVPNLPLGTYEMRVIVTAPNGQETVSDIIRAEVANQGPVLPNLIFSQSPTGLNVSWVPTDSGHNHIVQYKRSTEFTWTTAGEERFRNYLIIPNLTPGSYEFRVIVRNNLGVETVTDVYRVEVRETSGGQTGPALPNFNIQQTTTGTGLNISWVPVPGLPRNTYIVQYRRPGELTWTSGGQESFNNFIIIPSLPTGTYEFRIIVRNNLGQETISQIFRVEVRQASGTTGPQMPNFNVASTGVGTGLNVSWVPIPGAFGNTYIAQFRQPGAPTWTVGGQDTTNNYIIIPNLPVGTYEFRMIVRNNLGQETVSQIFRVQVQAAGDTLGEWSPWGVFEMASGRFIPDQCTRPCGGGKQFRGRQCMGTEAFCRSQQLEEEQDCNTQPCTNSTSGDSLGEWGPWGVVEMATGRFIEGECTRPCDGGVQFRGRPCTGSQSFCMGQQLEEVRDCNTQPCGPGNGTNTGGDSLGEWTPWGVVERTSGRFIEGECTRPCDGGVQFRGRQCRGSQSFCMSQQLEEVRDCNTQPCGPGNGTNTGGDTLGEWTPWGVVEMASGRFIEGECTRPCDGGVQFRGRQCRGSQSFCMSQQLEEVRDCNTQPCGSSSGTAGVTGPTGAGPLPPTNTGAAGGSGTSSPSIPGLGEWGPWGMVDTSTGQFVEDMCSRPCDGGLQLRSRRCDQGNCQGVELEEIRDCNTQPCSGSIGATGPVGQAGGSGTGSTGGDNFQLGEWSPWGVVELATGNFIPGQCTRTCGGGAQFRGRQCTGAGCNTVDPRQLEESRECNTEPCQGTGGSTGPSGGAGGSTGPTGGDVTLGQWGEWGVVELATNNFIPNQCTTPCGGGIQFRRRECTGAPLACQAQQVEEVRTCNQQPCTDGSGTGGGAGGNYEWGPWGPWGVVELSSGEFIVGECTLPCGGGFQFRTRNCSRGECPPPFPPDASQSQRCNEDPCEGGQGGPAPGPLPGPQVPPQISGFSQWTDWSPCPVQCGGGNHTRSRTCASGDPSTCQGDLVQGKPCNTIKCNSIVSANMVDAHIALNGQDSGFSFFCWINQEFSNQCTFNSPGGTANAYYMDGNDDKSEVYIREDFTKNDFTLSIWARPVQVDDRILLAYWDWQFAWRQKFLFGIKDSQVEMKVRNEMEEDLYDLRGGQVRAGMWNHIVVTYQKATNTMNIYLNGVRVGSQTITDPVKNKEIMPMYMDRFAPDVFQLGWMPNPQNERAYNGHMKDLLVLNRSLSDNEVRALFQENLW